MVDLCVTARCNMRCKHCFAASREQLPEKTTFEQLKYVIGRLKEAKVFIITITGGEPLMRGDFFEIVEYIKQFPIRIGLNTNAALVTDRVSKKIAAAGFKSRISVSLDGSNKQSYELLRGPGTFEPAIRGLENLLKYNKNIRPFCVVNSYNFRELEDIIKLAKSLGAPRLELNGLMRGERSGCYQDLFLSAAEKIEAVEKTLELKEIYGGYINGSFVRTARMAKRLRETPDNELLKLKPGFLQNCNAGFEMAAIRADGKVAPCYAMLDYVVGDLFKDPLKAIWRDSLPLKEFRGMHKVSLRDIGPCKSCIYKGACNAGCRAGAYYHSNKTSLKAYDPGGCYLFLNRDSDRLK